MKRKVYFPVLIILITSLLGQSQFVNLETEILQKLYFGQKGIILGIPSEKLNYFWNESEKDCNISCVESIKYNLDDSSISKISFVGDNGQSIVHYNPLYQVDTLITYTNMCGAIWICCKLL